MAMGSGVWSELVLLEMLYLCYASSFGEAVTDSQRGLGVNLWMQVTGSHV